MKTRILHTKFWDDEFIATLDKSQSLLFLYLLTNDKVNIIGCYQVPDPIICVYTKMTMAELQKGKKVLEEAQKIFFKDGWVLLRNFSKYEKYTGEKNEVSASKLLTQMPKGVFDWYSKINDTPIDTPINTPTMVGTINHKSEIINHKLERVEVKNEEKIYKTRQYLDDIIAGKADEEVEVMAAKFGVSPERVVSISENILDWQSSKGKKILDYRATLRTWLRNNYGNSQQTPSSGGVLDLTGVE